MARRLSSRSSQPHPALAEQSFEITCSCGETLEGPRQPREQIVSCPHCGEPAFVLPWDCYAGAATPRSIRRANPGQSSANGLIDKLNHLAFWLRLRETRATLGGQLCTTARHVGQWVKRRLSAFRLWLL